MTVVTTTTDLPISAERARALATVPEVMQFVLAPVLTFSTGEFPKSGDRITLGFSASGRIYWLGVIPTWTHTITVVNLADREIYSNERGGPVKVWNHRLTFEPLDDRRCRYTDAVEVAGGPMGWGTALFARLIFHHRRRRWRLLASILAAERDRAA